MMPLGEVPCGGSAMYVLRLWRVSVRPVGWPWWRVPEAQSLQAMVECRAGVERVRKKRRKECVL